MTITEKTIDILKIILEKYMIPGLIALAISIIVYANTPQDFSLFVKLGQKLYITLFFLISLLIILLIKLTSNKIIILAHNNRIQKKRAEERAEKTKNTLLDIIDSMDPQSKNLIYYLLKHNNKQIIIPSSMFLPLPIQQYCDNSTFIVENEICPMDINNMKPEKWTLKPGIHATKIKIKENFYNELKWLETVNGSISRFK